MDSLSRHDAVVAMQRYFQGVMQEDLAAILAVFTTDARVTIYHGDSPQRQFHVQPRPGEESLADFYGHIWGNFRVHFHAFTYVVDAETPVCSALFAVTLTPKPGSPQSAPGGLSLRNCNFFWFRGPLIYDTLIYYANPELGAQLGLKSAPVTVPPR